MTALPSRLNGHVQADRKSDSRSFGGRRMREQLRDTALLVASLEDEREPDAAQLRERCGRLIARFADAVLRLGYPQAVCQDAMLAQCALLDEIALRHLHGESRASWELTPLQVERFDLHDAGVRVIDRMEARVREASPNADLLTFYAAILGLGFSGRYAIDGETQRNALITALRSRLEKIGPAADRPFAAYRSSHGLRGWLSGLSPWTVAGLVILVSAITVGLARVALDTQLAHDVPASAERR